MNKIALAIVLLIAWIYLLYIFRKEKLTAFYFIVGSCGFFGFAFVLFKDILAKYSSIVLMWLLEMCQGLFGWYEVFKKYNIIFINNEQASISLFVDYECCGLIEMLVVLSIVLFMPIFTTKKKVIYSILGIAYTMIANAIRLIVVTYAVAKFGNDYYYIAHSVIGRIVFYILTLVLYFYLVTYGQITKQHTGMFSYNDNKTKSEKKE